jgi:hypothetical protein
MPVEHLDTFPSLFPIPQLDCHIIAGGKAERLSRVYRNGTDIIRMSLEAGDLFRRIVIDDAQLKVVRASNDPVLASHETTGTDGHIGELKRLDRRARFVGPDVHVAAVERREDPWFCCPSAENSLDGSAGTSKESHIPVG